MHLKCGSFDGDHFISCTGTDVVPDQPHFGYQLLSLWICLKHPDLKQAYDSLNNVPPYHFWSLADHYPDLVSRLHVQVRIMGSFGLNGGIPWLTNTKGATCFVCKQGVKTVNHFLLECPGFKENLDSLWDKLKAKLGT